MDLASSKLYKAKVWVTGHTGMLGHAVCRRLESENCQVITAEHQTLDLTRQSDTEDWVSMIKPDVIIHCAAKVGGIEANRSYPADFIYQNLMMNVNVLNAAVKSDISKLVSFGSSCFYPKMAQQPIVESSLLSGPIEQTNEAYAVAKIASVKMSEFFHLQYRKNFISITPTNLFGPNKHHDVKNSHVITALIGKFLAAKKAGDDYVELWGTGTPLREFMHVSDAADGVVFLTKHYNEAAPINLSGGQTVSIAKLAGMIAEIVEYYGEIKFDHSKPDGMPKKSLDSQRISALGWQPKKSLLTGLTETIKYYMDEQ